MKLRAPKPPVPRAPVPPPRTPSKPKSVIVPEPPKKPKIAPKLKPKELVIPMSERIALAAQVKAAKAVAKAETAKKIKGLAVTRGKVTDKPGEQAKKRRGGTPPKKPPTPASWKPGQRGNPYVYDKKPDPNAPKHTMTSLAEAMYAMDADAIRAHEPKTVGEVAIRAAWLRAMSGDKAVLDMLWNRIFASQVQADPLSALLQQLGKSGALTPQIPQSQSETEEDDED